MMGDLQCGHAPTLCFIKGIIISSSIVFHSYVKGKVTKDGKGFVCRQYVPQKVHSILQKNIYINHIYYI